MGEETQPRLMRNCAAPMEAQVSPASVLALPLRQLFATPLWLATKDSALMRDMICLQLERRGLAGRAAQEAVFDFRIIHFTETQTLALAVALPGIVQAPLCMEGLGWFEPSARTYPLPPDEFVLWREEDRLVAVVTCGTEPAYFQALGEAELTEPVLQELRCIKLQLETTGVIDAIQGVTTWGEFPDESLLRLAETLELPVKNAERPAPVLPAERLRLIPVPVQRARQTATAKRRRKSLIAIAAGVYIFLLCGFLLRTAWLSVRCRRIEDDLKKNESLVNEIKTTAQRWDLLERAVNPEMYPVEQLLRCARLLPSEGVRFTLFKTTGGKIFIQGEAKNAPAAFKFSEDLKQSKEMQDYHWKMPQPGVLPNDNAEFQIEGERIGETTD